MKTKTAAELTAIERRIKELETKDDNEQLWEDRGLPAAFKPAGLAMNIHVPRLVKFLGGYRQEKGVNETYKQMVAKLTKDQLKRLAKAESLAATQSESPFCTNAECGNLALSAGSVCFFYQDFFLYLKLK